MSHENTLYKALGLAPSASAEEIETAYRQSELSLQGQPDALSLLRVAYDTLRNHDLRAAYDRKLGRQQTASTPVMYEVSAARSSRNRSRVFNWLILFFVAGGTSGYFWVKTPAAVPKKKEGTTTVTYVDLPPPPVALNPPQEADLPPALPTPSPNEGATPATSINTPLQDLPQLPPIRPSRQPKKPGFDAQHVSWSVFLVRQRNRSGSGVMIGPDRILTNCHVLAGGATNAIVVIHSLTKEVTKVEKYARLDGEDACLLFAPGAGSDSIGWGASSSLKPGDTVHNMGHPGGSSDIVWSEGSFETRISRSGETFLMSTNYCRPGSSGGPLLDNEGRLIGVVTAVQRFKAKVGDAVQYGNCISVTEETARALLSKPLFPIALAPAQYIPNY